MASRAVYIVAAKRTPFGTYGGKLKGITATELCRVAASSALKHGQVPVESVDSVIIGNVAQVSAQSTGGDNFTVEGVCLVINKRLKTGMYGVKIVIL